MFTYLFNIQSSKRTAEIYFIYEMISFFLSFIPFSLTDIWASDIAVKGFVIPPDLFYVPIADPNINSKTHDACAWYDFNYI